MKSSFKPERSKTKTVTFTDFPAGRPSDGYPENALSAPIEEEWLILPKEEIQKIEGVTASTDAITPLGFAYENHKDLQTKLAAESKLHEEDKETPFSFTVKYPLI